MDQNVRGLRRDEEKEELIASLRRRDVFAATLQETWLAGDYSLERHGYVAVCSGLSASEQSPRGSQGVAVVLSPAAQQARHASGSTVIRASARVIGLRLDVQDDDDRDLGLFVVSAYAPVGAAPDEEWDAFFADIDIGLQARRPGDILVLRMDGNAALGVRSKYVVSGVCGPYGEPYVNDAGRRLHTFLAVALGGIVPTWRTFESRFAVRVRALDGVAGRGRPFSRHTTTNNFRAWSSQLEGRLLLYD